MIQGHSLHQGSFGDQPLCTPSRPRHQWRSTEIVALYGEQMKDFVNHKRLVPPPSPDEVLGLVESGKWNSVVRRLDFIFSDRLLEKRWNELQPTKSSSRAQKLQEAIDRPESLRLSDAEQAVLRMLHTLEAEGYDPAHPSDKSLSLVKGHAAELDRDLDSRFKRGGRWSYRVLGAASLLSAEASMQESLQPCGVAVLREAQNRGLPRIMFPSHHVLGGDAVALIADFCSRQKILRGNIRCDRRACDMPNPDVFLISKDSPNNWLDPMRALYEQATARAGAVLIVEDELLVRDQDYQQVDVRGFITQAYQGRHELLFAQDYEEALYYMSSRPIAAVGSDLYMPEHFGSGSSGVSNHLNQKRLGNTIVHEILDSFLSEGTVDQLLAEARRSDFKIYDAFRAELGKLITIE